MSPLEVEHTTFVVERELAGRPAHVFRFWSDPRLKDRWAGCHPDWAVLEDVFDFRSGGAEVKRWRMPSGDELAYRAAYFDVVPGERIIYAYEMIFGERRASASLVTIEFRAEGKVTKLKVTEQAAFLDGGAQERIEGTEDGYDRLVAVIEQDIANVH